MKETIPLIMDIPEGLGSWLGQYVYRQEDHWGMLLAESSFRKRPCLKKKKKNTMDRNTGRHWILVAGFLATKRVENKLLVLERQFHFTVFCPKWLNQLRLCWSKSETPTQLQCNYLAIKKRKRKPLHLKDRSFIFPFFFVIDDFW